MKTKRIPAAFALSLVAGLSAGYADNAAVLVEADKDTVTKFIYVGNTSYSTTHPAVTVEGKARGLAAKAVDADGAAALIGEVSGYTLPNPGVIYSNAGIIGSGDHGVMGKGTSFGVHGEGVTGVKGKSTTSFGIGVQGETTNDGTGVKGTGQVYGVHATISNGGYWPSGLRAESGSSTNGNGVYATGGVGVYAEGYYTGVEAIGGPYGSGIYADGGDYSAYFEGDTYSGGTYEGSDLSLKENVRPVGYGLNTLMALKPKAYEMKAGVRMNKTTGTRLGLIAQDVQSVIPEAVRKIKPPARRNVEGEPENASRPEIMAISYTALIPVLIKAIQEQQARIETLEDQLRNK